MNHDDLFEAVARINRLTSVTIERQMTDEDVHTRTDRGSNDGMSLYDTDLLRRTSSQREESIHTRSIVKAKADNEEDEKTLRVHLALLLVILILERFSAQTVAPAAFTIMTEAHPRDNIDTFVEVNVYLSFFLPFLGGIFADAFIGRVSVMILGLIFRVLSTAICAIAVCLAEVPGNTVLASNLIMGGTSLKAISCINVGSMVVLASDALLQTGRQNYISFSFYWLINTGALIARIFFAQICMQEHVKNFGLIDSFLDLSFSAVALILAIIGSRIRGGFKTVLQCPFRDALTGSISCLLPLHRPLSFNCYSFLRFTTSNTTCDDPCRLCSPECSLIPHLYICSSCYDAVVRAVQTK